MNRHARLTLCAGLASLGLTSCATNPPDKPDPLTGAVQQPLKDLRLIQENTPPVLVDAVLAPYAWDKAADCDALRAQIAKLSKTLGPDVDAPPTPSHIDAENLVADVVRGTVNLPFRGVVRFVTGAEAHDRAVRKAVVAGVARRGYLRGVAESRDCPPQ